MQDDVDLDAPPGVPHYAQPSAAARRRSIETQEKQRRQSEVGGGRALVNSRERKEDAAKFAAAQKYRVEQAAKEAERLEKKKQDEIDRKKVRDRDRHRGQATRGALPHPFIPDHQSPPPCCPHAHQALDDKERYEAKKLLARAQARDDALLAEEEEAAQEAADKAAYEKALKTLEKIDAMVGRDRVALK